MNIKKICNPEYFQGNINKPNYFEGWFYKLEDSRHERVLAVIVGVATGKDPKDIHAFIQINDSKTGNTDFIKYDINEFKYDEDTLWIKLGDNIFTDKYIRLNVSGENFKIKGMLYFEDRVPYPKTILRPGIMGFFSYFSFMECYHGIVNISHRIMGSLIINGEEQNFLGGYGYIEKDWGTSFPKKWLWLQGNNFGGNDNATLMLAVADIPFMKRTFTGIIGFLYIDGEYHSLATYNGAYIKKFLQRENEFYINAENLEYSFYIRGKIIEGGGLKAPVKGMMTRDITETVKGEVSAIITKRGKVILRGESQNCGIELSGDVASMM